MLFFRIFLLLLLSQSLLANADYSIDSMDKLQPFHGYYDTQKPKPLLSKDEQAFLQKLMPLPKEGPWQILSLGDFKIISIDDDWLVNIKSRRVKKLSEGSGGGILRKYFIDKTSENEIPSILLAETNPSAHGDSTELMMFNITTEKWLGTVGKPVSTGPELRLCDTPSLFLIRNGRGAIVAIAQVDIKNNPVLKRPGTKQSFSFTARVTKVDSSGLSFIKELKGEKTITIAATKAHSIDAGMICEDGGGVYEMVAKDLIPLAEIDKLLTESQGLGGVK